jgi:phosphoglucosamine mutase
LSAPRRFGTDGIRAPFGTPPLDRETVAALGYELGAILVERHGADAGRGPAVILGGDTRASTPTLAEWLATGLEAAGAVPCWRGVVPTGGLAFLVRHEGAAAAAVVSASHNPYPDNGIKLIDEAGFKWSEAAEAELERRLDMPSPQPFSRGAGAGPREAATGGDATPRSPVPLSRPAGEGSGVRAYLDYLVASVPGVRPLAGLRVALDTGNGAASSFAGALFERLGAEVAVIHAAPDGSNINAGCGSTDPRALAALVKGHGFDLGFAFDGDADRVILVDELGAERDGDAVLYLWARDLARRGELDPPAIVATSMSNLGLERALAVEGVEVLRSDVGDREVVKLLRERGLVLGGEQSGHIVHLGLSTTGDGLLTALQVAAQRARAGRPISELLAGFVRFPQILLNVRVAEKPRLESIPEVSAAVAQVAARLGREGRLVLRYSGTEPLARVMIEGPDEAEITTLAESVAASIRATIGASSARSTA